MRAHNHTNNKKRHIMKRTIFLMLAVLLSALSASAYAFKVDGIAYNKNGDGKSVYVSYGGDYTGPVTIPERVTYDGATYSVTSIGEFAFKDCTGLTSVTIPTSVTSIGEEAFRGCTGLTSVTIPNSVISIGYSAFGGTPWYNNQPDGVVYIGKVAYEFKGEMASGTAINIKEGTVSISGYAFYGCTGLTSITIPNSVTSIGEFTFSGCTGLTSVTIPSSVTSIGKSAFSGCTDLTSVTIPNSVTTIGWSAFRGCAGLTSVTIPNSVTEIGWSAFEGCTALTSVTFNATNCKSPGRTYEAWFQDCPLTSLVIGNDVKSIPACLAYYQTRLTTVTIPNSVISIGWYAFVGCTGLTSVTIPNSVTEIGYSAFYGCTGLTSVTIPNSITKIRDDTFKGCTGLTSVTIPNSVTTIGYDAFSGCTGLTSVTIPNSVTTIGGSAFRDCTGLTSVTIPNSVTSIGRFAFEGTPWYNNQPDGVVYIGKMAYKFKGEMTSGTAINIKEGTVSICPSAFEGCTALTSVTIPNSVTTIGYDTFMGCTGLTSVTIPNSVTSIGGFAFSGCTGLTSVTIPNSVTTIGGSAFSGCTGLKKIYSLNPVPPVIYWDTFVAYDVDLFVPKGCVPKYKEAKYWKDFRFIGEIEEEGGIDDVIGADSKIKYDGGTITISVPSEIAVYSIDGRLVATANGVSLDTESLTHGTYVVRAVDAHGNVQTLKFTK